MVVKLHHLGKTTRSQRVIWLLEELGIEYEIVFHKRLPSFLAPPEVKKVHPLGKCPIITDGDLVLAETGLIMEYLIETYGPQLAPTKTDKKKYLEYKYWLYFGEGSAMPSLIFHFILANAVKKTPFILRWFARIFANGIGNFYSMKNIKGHAQFMEDVLAKKPKGWFVDELSGADFMLCFPVEGTGLAIGLSEYPELSKFWNKVQERPAWKRAMERGAQSTKSEQ